MDVFVFRGIRAGPSLHAQWCAAPIDVVSKTFGAGGLYGELGLVKTFGGGALFRNERDKDVLLGVWGARRCSRFRRLLREGGHTLTIRDLPEDIRLSIRWG